MISMFKVLWDSIMWERWFLMLIGFIFAGHYEIINLPFEPMFWGLIAIAAVMVIRIIAKGVWLNGKSE